MVLNTSNDIGLFTEFSTDELSNDNSSVLNSVNKPISLDVFKTILKLLCAKHKLNQ